MIKNIDSARGTGTGLRRPSVEPRRNVGLVCVLAAAVLPFGCVANVDQETELNETQDPLYLTGATWPSGEVGVCFNDNSEQMRLASRVRGILNATWAKVANVVFTGWGICGSDESVSLVHLQFWDDLTKGTTDVVGRTSGHNHVWLPKADSGDHETFFYFAAIHEFGHVLGFHHEQERPDNWGLPVNGPAPNPLPNPIYCSSFQPGRESPVFYGQYLTSYDKESIMNYCAAIADPNMAHLSNGDIYGATTTYTKRAGTPGFMIANAQDPTLFVKAWGYEQYTMYLTRSCTQQDPTCTWAFRDGMLVNDADPRLAINAWGGAREYAVLKTTTLCEKSNKDCTWTYTKGSFLSDNDTSLAIMADPQPSEGSLLVIRSGCAANDLSCRWTLSNVMLMSHNRPDLAVNAWGGASFGAYLRLTNLCLPTNLDCLWNFDASGMIKSANTGNFAINAYNGAHPDTYLRLHNGCDGGNGDCTWTWSRGGIYSDRDPDLGIFTNNASNTDGAYLMLSSMYRLGLEARYKN